MTLNIGGSPARMAFAMTAGGNARFIKFDAAGGSGIIGSGSMEKADTTAFSTARITGDYAFGGAGFDNGNNRAAMMTRFTSNGTGVLTNAAGDVNAYGTNYAMNFTAANYVVTDGATGRGTMRIAFTFGGAPDTMNFVFYVVNSGKLFAMESDAVSTATPLQRHRVAAASSDRRFFKRIAEWKQRDFPDGAFTMRDPGGRAKGSSGLAYDERRRGTFADLRRKLLQRA
jgi:hypothetical protein